MWMRAGGATLKDVAKAVGVTPSTASVVLNGSKSGTRVSQATREAIEQAARDLGYRPNGIARALSRGVANRIGFYSGISQLDARNSFFAEVLGGVQAGCADLNFDLLLHTSGHERAHLLNFLTDRSVDGVIMHVMPHDPILDVLRSARVPAVAFADEQENVPSVVVDDEGGGQMAARRLAERGHRDVLVFQCPAFFRSAMVRQLAFTSEAERLGLRVFRHSSTDWGGRTIDFHREALGRFPSVTGIFTWEDQVAYIVMAALAERGVRVGEEVDVIGFNGFPPPFATPKRLTTIDAHWAGVGRKALSLLRTMIDGGEVEPTTVMPVRLLEGETG